MSVHLQREIERLKKKIILLGGEVEESLQKAVRSLRNRDLALARAVIENDAAIDRAEVEFEEECLKILALDQPVAMDLRFVVAVLKINNDLERIADMAVNMADRALDLSQGKRPPFPAQLTMMVDAAQSMLKRSLDALVNMNTALAWDVIRDDDLLDALHAQMYQYVQDAIRSDLDQVGSYISLLTISRQLERTADLVTNIAEDVIYMVDGEIVRHKI